MDMDMDVKIHIHGNPGIFAPHGRHLAPIKVKFGMEERTVGFAARGRRNLAENAPTEVNCL